MDFPQNLSLRTPGQRVFRRVVMFLVLLTAFNLALLMLTEFAVVFFAPLTFIPWRFVYQGIKQTWDDPDNRILRFWSMGLMLVAFVVIVATMLLAM